jgi:hypothetical protein
MMPVVFAIAICLSFIIIIAAVLSSLASTRESREIRQQRAQTLTRPLALLSITDAFDPIFSILWEAPIAALELMDSAGPAGIQAARLRPIFVKSAACFPEIYDGCSFVQWLQFLEHLRLVSWNGYRLVLTPEARQFLKYRFTTDALVEA